MGKCTICGKELERNLPVERITVMVNLSDMTIQKAGGICPECKRGIKTRSGEVMNTAVFDGARKEIDSILHPINPKNLTPGEQISGEESNTGESKSAEEGNARKPLPDGATKGQGGPPPPANKPE